MGFLHKFIPRFGRREVPHQVYTGKSWKKGKTADLLLQLTRVKGITTQADAARVLGVSRQRLSQLVYQLGLDELKRKPTLKHTVTCPDCRGVREFSDSELKRRKTQYCRSCSSRRTSTRQEQDMPPPPRLCASPKCRKTARWRGLCHHHYNHMIGKSSGFRDYPYAKQPFCGVEGCNLEHYARGKCRNHYARMRNRETGRVKVSPTS